MKIKLPGLIDPHVHLRAPGGEHKEDFDSGTRAALAGGFTHVLAMPNTKPPLMDVDTLRLARQIAENQAHCDIGLFVGAGLHNADAAAAAAPLSVGLKIYLDATFGDLKIDRLDSWIAHFEKFPHEKPIVAHAEEGHLAAMIGMAKLFQRPIHIAHVSRASEIALIRRAKDQGLPITCEVGPHHLFLCNEDTARIGVGRCEVRPRLQTRADMLTLRANLDVIDCFATDHAPHLLSEKDSPTPPPGFPGLETALALYLELVRDGLITLDQLIDKCHTRPREIFHLPKQEDTWIEVDTDEKWITRGADMQTRAKWTPFEGREMHGRVKRVVLRGRQVSQPAKMTRDES